MPNHHQCHYNQPSPNKNVVQSTKSYQPIEFLQPTMSLHQPIITFVDSNALQPRHLFEFATLGWAENGRKKSTKLTHMKHLHTHTHTHRGNISLLEQIEYHRTSMTIPDVMFKHWIRVGIGDGPILYSICSRIVIKMWIYLQL